MENKAKYEELKTPLAYQATEYDCGTTTLINALRYLFARGEICPTIYKHIMQFTLDQTNEFGEVGKGGTSVYALEFLCNWLNANAANKGMKIICKNLPKDQISIYNEELENKIKNGGVAILRVHQEGEHYCLLTKIDKEYAYIFDPYYLDADEYDDDEKVEIVKNRQFEFNRKVKKERIDEESKEDFALVKGKNRGIIIIEKG